MRDTRDSGPMLEAALAAGIAAGRGRRAARRACCRRRPPRSWSAATGSTWPRSSPPRTTRGATTGSSSSAPTGRSWTTIRTPRVEAFVHERLEGEPAAEGVSHSAETLGRVETLEAALADYLRELGRTFGLDLSGRSVALDCANGATYRAAPRGLRAPGATVEADRRTSPTGATSTTASARPIPRRSRSGCGARAPSWASPSTATATGSWRWTRRGRFATATS